jgi:hypothetical protein
MKYSMKYSMKTKTLLFKYSFFGALVLTALLSGQGTVSADALKWNGDICPIPTVTGEACAVSSPTHGTTYQEGDVIRFTGEQTVGANGTYPYCTVILAIGASGLRVNHDSPIGANGSYTYVLGSKVFPTTIIDTPFGPALRCAWDASYQLPRYDQLPSGLQAAVDSGDVVYAVAYPVYTQDPSGNGWNRGTVREHIYFEKPLVPLQGPDAWLTTVKDPLSPRLDSGSIDISVDKGENILFVGDGNDPDGTIAVKEWRTGGGSCMDGSVVSANNTGAYTVDTSSLTPGTHQYFFSVIDNDGYSSGSSDCLTVNLKVLGTPSITFSANPMTVPYQGSSTLSWVISDADNCDFDAVWGGFGINDSPFGPQFTDDYLDTFITEATNDYKIYCINENGGTSYGPDARTAEARLTIGITGAVPIGSCGAADGTTRTTAPTLNSDLCADGRSSSVTDTGTSFDWTCTPITLGSDSANCSATKSVVPINQLEVCINGSPVAAISAGSQTTTGRVLEKSSTESISVYYDTNPGDCGGSPDLAPSTISDDLIKNVVSENNAQPTIVTADNVGTENITVSRSGLTITIPYTVYENHLEVCASPSGAAGTFTQIAYDSGNINRPMLNLGASEWIRVFYDQTPDCGGIDISGSTVAETNLPDNAIAKSNTASSGARVTAISAGMQEQVTVQHAGKNITLNYAVNNVSVSVDGACGSSAWQTFTSRPTTDLCAAGQVNWTDPYTYSDYEWGWRCEGTGIGSDAYCTADAEPLTSCPAGQGTFERYSTTYFSPCGSFCVSHNTSYINYDPMNRNTLCQCNPGEAPYPMATNPIADPAANCGATETMVYCCVPETSNAACGSSDGGLFTAKPNSNLCLGSTPSTVTDTGTRYEWNCTDAWGAVSCSADKVGGYLDGACGSNHDQCLQGSWSDGIDTVTEYKWTCEGSGAGSSDMSCSFLRSVATPVNVTLSANPVNINSGDSTDLTWTVSGSSVTSCIANASPSDTSWSGNKNTVGGSDTINNILADTTYTLTCSGPGGTDSDDATVTVNTPLPTVDLQASPTHQVSGMITVLTWNVANAVSCTASNGWAGAKDVVGDTESVIINTDTTYRLTCANSNGDTAYDEVSVTTELVKFDLATAVATQLDATETSPDGVNGIWEDVDIKMRIRNEGNIELPTSSGVPYMIHLDSDPRHSGTALEVSQDSSIGYLNNALLPGYQTNLLTRRLENVPFGDNPTCARANLDPTISITNASGTTFTESALELANNQRCGTVSLPVPPPPMSISADPSLISNGASTMVNWSVEVTYPSLECRVVGPGGVDTPTFLPYTAGVGVPYVASVVTGMLENKSIYTLICTETITNTVFSTSTAVEVVPTVYEI